MLALRRKPKESLVLSHPNLPGDIIITLVRIEQGRVLLGVKAHRSILIVRDELLRRDKEAS